MTPLIYYTAAEVGCYADGCYGHERCRHRLYELTRNALQRSFRYDAAKHGALLASLQGAMPDDAWDENEALDILNQFCADDVCFTFQDGNLVLSTTEEES